MTGNCPVKNKEDTTMSEEKKTAATEEVNEDAHELTDKELAQANGGDNFNVTDWNGYSSQS